MIANLGVDASADGWIGDPDGAPAPGAWLSLFADLNAGVRTLANRIDQQNRLEQNRLAHLPVSISLDRISQPGAAVFDVQDFGGPQPGREWVVRLLIALAVPLAANATAVTWYVGQNMPGPAAGMLPATMAVWQFLTVPGLEDFSNDAVTVKAGERLLAGLTNIPAQSVIMLGASINDQLATDVDRRG